MEIVCICIDLKCESFGKSQRNKPDEAPHLSQEKYGYFIGVKNLPCVQPREIAASHTQEVDWLCEKCSEPFSASPNKITRRKDNQEFQEIFCTMCSRKKQINKSGALFSDSYPKEAEEFLKNLTTPWNDLHTLKVHSRDKCEWQCSYCPNVWITSPSNRRNSARGKGCNSCNKKKIGTAHMENSAGRILLRDLHPDKHANLVGIVGRPEADLSKISVGSNQVGLWKCACGAQFERKVNRVVARNSIYCRPCSSSGKSLLEFEVAALIELMTGLEVQTHHYKGKNPEVDLYLPSSDTAIQIDPYWSHYHKVDKDIVITSDLEKVYQRVLRIRGDGLSDVGETIRTKAKTAQEWVSSILPALNVGINQADDTQIKNAMISASTKWMNCISNGPEVKNSCKDAVWVSEFVENITHPGKRIEFSVLGSEDKCIWQCACGNRWTTRIERRAKSALGCPPCRRKNKLAVN